MTSNAYHFITIWRIPATPEEVTAILGDAPALARWWPSVYLRVDELQPGDVNGLDVVDGANNGDDACRWCLEVLAERLGVGIANAINTFDPLEVVIGGGVSRAGELLLEPARRSADRHVVPGLGLRTKVRIARHGPRAGVLGAALLAAQEYAESSGLSLPATIAGEAAT